MEYRLLNDNDLQARLHPALSLLLDWRDAALHVERLEESSTPMLEDDGASVDGSQTE